MYHEFDYQQLTAKNKIKKKQVLGKRVNQLKLISGTTIPELLDNMAEMSIQARNLGQCAKVLENIYMDKDRPTVLLGLAGPLIAAGLRHVICDLVRHKAVDVIVSTGAIIYQDIYAAFGFGHYLGTPDADDKQLRELLIDRIYDTYIDEEKVWQTDRFCGKVADKLGRGVFSSRSFIEALASEIKDKDSIVYQCKKHSVPIFVPAINDSSIGIGLTEHRVRALKQGKKPIIIDSIRDNHELVQIVVKSKKTAAFYVAGGVPKNYINDSIVMAYIYGLERGHDYALQITTAVTADGGLSSSTLSEGRSWGKIKKQANTAFAWVEPSVSLPLLTGYILGKKLTKSRKRLNIKWDQEKLLTI